MYILLFPIFYIIMIFVVMYILRRMNPLNWEYKSTCNIPGYRTYDDKYYSFKKQHDEEFFDKTGIILTSIFWIIAIPIIVLGLIGYNLVVSICGNNENSLFSKLDKIWSKKVD